MIHNTKSLVWIQVDVLNNYEFKNNLSQIVLLKDYLQHPIGVCALYGTVHMDNQNVHPG